MPRLILISDNNVCPLLTKRLALHAWISCINKKPDDLTCTYITEMVIIRLYSEHVPTIIPQIFKITETTSRSKYTKIYNLSFPMIFESEIRIFMR